MIMFCTSLSESNSGLPKGDDNLDERLGQRRRKTEGAGYTKEVDGSARLIRKADIRASTSNIFVRWIRRRTTRGIRIVLVHAVTVRQKWRCKESRKKEALEINECSRCTRMLRRGICGAIALW